MLAFYYFLWKREVTRWSALFQLLLGLFNFNKNLFSFRCVNYLAIETYPREQIEDPTGLILLVTWNNKKFGAEKVETKIEVMRALNLFSNVWKVYKSTRVESKFEFFWNLKIFFFWKSQVFDKKKLKFNQNVNIYLR